MPILTITAAIASQFQMATLVGTVIGGIIGSRADSLLCKGTSSLYSRIKRQAGEPVNHDIQRATRRAYLKATLLAADHVRKAYIKESKFGSRTAADLGKLTNYLKEQLRLLDQPTIQFPEDTWPNQYQYLLESKNVSADQRQGEYVLALKQTVLTELESKSWKLGEDARLVASIVSGWFDHGKKMDWYELTCAFFTEELKAGNGRLLRLIQKNYLVELSHDLSSVSIDVNEVLTELERFAEQYDGMQARVDEILDLVLEIRNDTRQIREITDHQNVKLDELIALVKQGKAQELVVENAHGIVLSAKYQKLTSRVQQLEGEAVEAQEYVNFCELDVQRAPSAFLSHRTRSLNLAQIKLLAVHDERLEAEEELKEFVTEVLDLARQLDREDTPVTPRLEQVQELFAAGRYEEVDAVLNERDIYSDLENYKQRGKDYAAELIIKAKVVIVNRPDRWYELADKYYRDAIEIQDHYDSFYEYGVFLAEHRQIASGIQVYSKCLPLAPTRGSEASVLNNLASLQWAQKDYAAAADNYTEALLILRDLATDNPHDYRPGVASMLNNLALLQNDQNDYAAAAGNYTEALLILRDLATDNLRDCRPGIAVMLNNLANLQRTQNKYAAAADNYAEALAIYRELATGNPRAYRPGVARTLNNLALLQKHQNDYAAAANNYAESLVIRRELAADNPRAYRSGVARTLDNLANLQRTQNKYAAAADNYAEALAIRRDLAVDNPRAYRPDVAVTLNNLALLQHAQKDYSAAAANYTEALAIRRDLAADNPRVYRPDVAVTLNNLANLRRAQKDYSTAAAHYAEALAIRRDLAVDNPQTHRSYLAMVLNNLANLQSDQKDYAVAVANYSEALILYRELAVDNPRVYRPYVAGILNNLAILQSDQDDYSAAAANYAEALAIYHELAVDDPQAYRPYYDIVVKNLEELQ
ncbi:tetratricopeptide repeat protein [Lewinella sp. IMCC34191]|uniref:tetratricopeptide repeat protein n=1 Tax=Lewinella sp. IMCC34191 TaxID=2259172 RepID=UPI000E26CD91|nr:tetratricopeptide repeat protein [Lewinella sp. IMCC34191]